MADVYKFDRAYGVSALLFDSSVSPYSPADFQDLERVVNYDEDGKEVVSFVPVDYKKIADQLGCVDDWSISALLKAGINPNFPVRTGSSISRLEGVESLQGVSSEVDVMFNDNVKEVVDNG